MNSAKYSDEAIDFRRLCRDGSYTGPTAGKAAGFAQANLVIVPKEYALDLVVFLQRNPKPCPLLGITDPGSCSVPVIAEKDDFNIYTDCPKYRIWKDGEVVEEVTDVTHIQKSNPDMVGFLLGCSFSFENALLTAGLDVRHITESVNVPMFRTNIKCVNGSGAFSKGCDMVVSMRPYNNKEAIQSTIITSRYERVHGAPIHIGDPKAIGITKSLQEPDFGDPVTIQEDEVPVFWACGVTPQIALENAKLPLAITHSPGHMLVLDVTNEDLS